MRLKSKEPFPFILSGDEDLPEAERTTWWIKPLMGVGDVPQIENAFKLSEIEKRGKVTYDTKRRSSAYRKTLSLAVGRIENICFPEGHPNHKDGFRDIEEENVALREQVFDHLTTDEMGELIEQANRGYSITEAEKKNRNSDVLPAMETGQPNGSSKKVRVPDVPDEQSN